MVMAHQLKQFSDEHASIFQDASVVAAYRHRPPYPTETFDILAGLMDKMVSPRRILDAGCGTGQLASMLRQVADRIDAVDVSVAMIEAGKRMPYGSDPRINWIVGRIEQVPLNPPYALIVAAASIHWIPWETTLSRFARVLSQNGYLALVEGRPQPNAWDKEVSPIVAHYSMNRDFHPYNMLTVANELEGRGLFRQMGVLETTPVLFRQPVAAWVESFHARNGFSRERMGDERAAEFGQRLSEIISRYCPSGEVEQLIGARVVFGKPLVAAE
jgi:SAM-dependent methyltransferase